MSLRPPQSVRKLQSTLHAKAKEAPSYRLYSLYDKVYREDVLAYAYRKCRRNGGAPGVDGESFADIESEGVEQWLDALRSLRGRGLPRPPTAPSVAVSEAQSEGSGYRTLPRRNPIRRAGSDPAHIADTQLSVGEGVKSCPKAGCGEIARPV